MPCLSIKGFETVALPGFGARGRHKTKKNYLIVTSKK